MKLKLGLFMKSGNSLIASKPARISNRLGMH